MVKLDQPRFAMLQGQAVDVHYAQKSGGENNG